MEIQNKEIDREEIINKEKQEDEVNEVQDQNLVILQSESEGYFFKSVTSEYDVLQLLNFALQSFEVLRKNKINKFPSYIQ